MTAELETIIFNDVNAFGLNKQVWDWQSQNLVEIIKAYPDELLPLVMRAPIQNFGRLPPARNALSRKIEFRWRDNI
jgi:hypothetical protein